MLWEQSCYKSKVVFFWECKQNVTQIVRMFWDLSWNVTQIML